MYLVAAGSVYRCIVHIFGVAGRGGGCPLYYMYITFFIFIASTVSCLPHATNSQAHAYLNASPMASVTARSNAAPTIHMLTMYTALIYISLPSTVSRRAHSTHANNPTSCVTHGVRQPLTELALPVNGHQERQTHY